jgi:hypothetical protein
VARNARNPIAVVYQHTTLLEQGLKSVQNKIEPRIEQGVSGGQQFSLRLANDQRLVECDPGIAVEHRVAAADQSVPVLERWRNPKDLEAALLSLRDPAAEQLECLAEEGADEVRLQPACLTRP